MHPAPYCGKNRRLWIKLLEAHRDSRGVYDCLTIVERDRRHRYLSRRKQQLLALEVVDLDHFELDALEREQLAHLGAERTAEKLVKLRRHHRPLSAWITSSRSRSEIEARTTSAAARSLAGAIWHSASTFMPARCAASIPAGVPSTTRHSSASTGSRWRSK